MSFSVACSRQCNWSDAVTLLPGGAPAHARKGGYLLPPGAGGKGGVGRRDGQCARLHGQAIPIPPKNNTGPDVTSGPVHVLHAKAETIAISRAGATEFSFSGHAKRSAKRQSTKGCSQIRIFVRWQGKRACHEGVYSYRIRPTWQAKFDEANGRKDNLGAALNRSSCWSSRTRCTPRHRRRAALRRSRKSPWSQGRC